MILLISIFVLAYVEVLTVYSTSVCFNLLFNSQNKKYLQYIRDKYSAKIPQCTKIKLL